MKTRLLLLLTLCILSHPLLPAEPAGGQSALILATTYRPDIDVSQYLISEKLDGVRARWDGGELISKGGLVFAAPTWFTQSFPPTTMDGELWIGRGRFEQTSSIVRKQHPHDAWRKIKLMIFDLPIHGGAFRQRVQTMRQLVADTNSPYLGLIQQFRVKNREELMQRLQAVIDNGGEGLMLHKQSALYTSGRSNNLLKLKLFEAAEAEVIGYRPGKGRFQGMVGSLKVRTKEGMEFYVGSGLTIEQRQHPPLISSWITFKFQGLTGNGLPRFPVFLRIRQEEPE